MIKLKPRLLEIVSLILPPNAEKMPLAVCDVGTDHGYIPIYCVQNGIKFAIASDVSKSSAQKAFDNIKLYSLQDKIDVRVGDGLEVLSDNEVDTVIIAGMGGILMTEILSKGLPKGINKIILQPMRSVYELRKWLYNNKYIISDESLVYEGKRLYNILVIEKGIDKNKAEFDFLIGTKLLEKQHPLFLDYAKKEYKRINKVINGINLSKGKIDDLLLSFNDKLLKIIKSGGAQNVEG